MNYTYRTLEKYARIVCTECQDLSEGKDNGERFLSQEQYSIQLADPNRGWRCPYCHCYPCDFDDDYIELPLLDK